MNIDVTREHVKINTICKVINDRLNAIRVGYNKEGLPLLVVPYGGRLLVRNINMNSILVNVNELGKLLYSDYSNCVEEQKENIIYLDNLLQDKEPDILKILSTDYVYVVSITVEDDWYGKR